MFGNVCVRHVARPQIISTYFEYSNVVDLHNMSRQNDLALEKKWITLDGLFRIYTTTIGMLVTDMWKIFRVHNKSEDLFTSKSIIQFADALAYEMINWAGNFEEKEERNEIMNPTTVCVSVDGTNDVSTLTPEIRHDMMVCEGSRQLRCVWCSRVHLKERKTTMYCLQCKKGFCRGSVGRSCWNDHILYGGCPPAPRRGAMKENMMKIAAV